MGCTHIEGGILNNQINQKNIQQILEYWYIIEFLGQDKFPNEREFHEKIQSYKKSLEDGKKTNIKQITAFSNLSSAKDVLDIIKKEAFECRMMLWGNITIYVGKVRRESCIRGIIKELNISKDDRPETSEEKIAMASLQLTPNGEYVENSLSLSPVLWALQQLGNTTESLSDRLRQEKYDQTIIELEKVITPKDKDAEPQVITTEDLKRLYSEICSNYTQKLEYIDENSSFIQEYYGFFYQMFRDADSKEKYEDDNYTGLSRDYFSKDIKMLMEKNKCHELDQNMINYISVLYRDYLGDIDIQRIDLVHNGNPEDYELQLNQILRIDNAPLGKWPSQFMPALMQQMAINLTVGKNIKPIFGENGNVFSINGPPGTGKTTLLKEIIVHNIVERAILLSAYDKPDKAFDQHDFIDGTKPENAYSKYTRHWYTLKNDKINDYSTLVTSCNNAAVENISKELPVETSMLKDLEASDDSPKILKEQLEEVRHLFDISQSDEIETLFGWDQERHGEYNDIYFTEYANELLDSNDSWGLIAAPLGKKSNIKKFYYKVLVNLLRDFYANNEMVEERLQSYTRVRERFHKQLHHVQEMQGQLAQYGELSIKRLHAKKMYEKILDKNNNLMVNEKEKKVVLYEKCKKVEEELENEKLELSKLNTNENRLKDTIKKLDEEYASYKSALVKARENVLNVQNSIGFLSKLFKTKKYKDAMILAELHRKEAEEIETSRLKNQDNIEKVHKEFNTVISSKNQLIRMIREYKSKTDIYKKQIDEIDELINKYLLEISNIKDSYDKIQEHYDDSITKFTSGSIDEIGIAANFEYVGKIFSKNNKESTKAQVENPWTSHYFNREREKLFFYAMKLNKEFVLASKCCRDNFRSLGHYWGLTVGDSKEKIEYTKNDKERCSIALIQTLFLLVPVISSTFASVSTFFKDVKNSGVIGMLVVDEAGQAQPQMALGALFRARRALIVGDPKQVEPVVTDELKLLKRTFDEKIYYPYKEKSVSVQGCADLMNTFGTFMENKSDNPEWVGCPLLVHRRCISPMYEISNQISYNGMMKQQTREPKEELLKTFIYDKSQWINIIGKEEGRRKHFVNEQGEKVCEMLEIAFTSVNDPNVYIISPFTTVINGIRDYIKRYCASHRESDIRKGLSEWVYNNIGTVHTFQGKEAYEVIFLLGCDDSKDAEGAIGWVNNNIVNVAVTRAMYRLYIIGNAKAWNRSICISTAKSIMDSCISK
jgi:superfamily I DNA and/or RNA helicase